MNPKRLGAAAALVVAASVSLRPQTPDYARSHYTKYEYRIPMRDGVKLFTVVYVPKDESTARTRSC